ENALHDKLEKIFGKTQAEHAIKAEGERVDWNIEQRYYAGDRDRPRRRDMPEPQQGREAREHQPGGDEGQIADKAMRPAGGERIPADHYKPGAEDRGPCGAPS